MDLTAGMVAKDGALDFVQAVLKALKEVREVQREWAPAEDAGRADQDAAAQMGLTKARHSAVQAASAALAPNGMVADRGLISKMARAVRNQWVRRRQWKNRRLKKSPRLLPMPTISSDRVHDASEPVRDNADRRAYLAPPLAAGSRATARG